MECKLQLRSYKNYILYLGLGSTGFFHCKDNNRKRGKNEIKQKKINSPFLCVLYHMSVHFHSSFFCETLLKICQPVPS